MALAKEKQTSVWPIFLFSHTIPMPTNPQQRPSSFTKPELGLSEPCCPPGPNPRLCRWSSFSRNPTGSIQ